MIRAVRNARPLGGHDPVDLVLRDGIIAAVAPAGALEIPSTPEVIDADGRHILPGLWDEHVHMTQWAQARRRIDVGEAESAAEAAAIVRRALTGRDSLDEVIVGVGFRDGLWPDTPTAAVLDAVVADRPVVLISADVHAAWLNSAAMVRFGIDTGEGLVREDAAFAVTRDLDSASDAVIDEWVREAGAEAAARGVVGIVDLEMRWNLDDWLRRVGQGFDALRVEFGVYPQHLDRAIAQGLRSGLPVAGEVSVGPLKVITDGSLNTRTAYCCDPYPDASEHAYGLLTVPPCELQPLMARGYAAGFQLAIHAIGDAANRLALDAFARLGHGGRIEHAQLLRRGDLRRFAALGVTASVQPEHAMDDRDIAERYWAGRTHRSFPIRDLIDSGARVIFGSDAPVAPLDPWMAISAATARTRDDREPFHGEQAISIAEALAASTRSRIAAGEHADLVIVEEDPLATDPRALRTMAVTHTLLAGRPTFGPAVALHGDAATAKGHAVIPWPRAAAASGNGRALLGDVGEQEPPVLLEPVRDLDGDVLTHLVQVRESRDRGAQRHEGRVDPGDDVGDQQVGLLESRADGRNSGLGRDSRDARVQR
jgi:predicted amidohydrolase YtcJ